MGQLKTNAYLLTVKADQFINDVQNIITQYLHLNFNDYDDENIPEYSTSYKVLTLSTNGYGQTLYDTVVKTITDHVKETTLLKARTSSEFRPLWALLDCWNNFLQSLWAISRLLNNLQSFFIDKNIKLDSVDVFSKKIFTTEIVMQQGVIEKLDGFLRNPTNTDYRGRVYSQVPDMFELLNEANGRRISIEILTSRSKVSSLTVSKS